MLPEMNRMNSKRLQAWLGYMYGCGCLRFPVFFFLAQPFTSGTDVKSAKPWTNLHEGLDTDPRLPLSILAFGFWSQHEQAEASV